MNTTTLADERTADAPPPPKFDFPAWLPPMLVKELRQGLRQRGFVGGLIGVQVVLLIVFVTGFVSETGNGSSRGMIDGFFWAVTGFVLLASAPLRAMSGLSAEIEARTMDLLLLTRLDAWRIVWGKWVSLQTQTVLMAVTLLPYAVVRYFFGSVDLVGDFGILAGMLLGGAVLTGVGLWASGLPKALRFLITAGATFSLFSLVNGLVMAMRYGGASFRGMGGGGSGVEDWVSWGMAIWAGAVALTYVLSLAVRWFAPPAENHAIWPRLAPLALALPAPLLAWAGWRELAAVQAATALGALAAAAAIELAGTRDVMAIHFRGWMTRSRWRRAWPLFLPGWPSASAWLAAMLAVALAALAVVDAVVTRDLPFWRVAWLGALAWAGLMFPALLVALVPTARRVSAVVYFALHGLLALFAIMAGSTGLGRLAPTSMRVLDWISHAVPTTSFWHALMEFEKPSGLPAVEFGQAVGVALTLTMMLFLARPYWERVRVLRAQAARAEADGTRA